MKKVLVNFSSYIYLPAQTKSNLSAKVYCNFDKIISLNPIDLDFKFLLKNFSIFIHKKGFGYWLWKPYVVLKALKEIEDGDILCYLDCGDGRFVHSVNSLIDWWQSDPFFKKQHILTFQTPFLEKYYSKMEAFSYFSLNKENYFQDKQILGGFFFIKKNQFTQLFFEELLVACQVRKLLTDCKSKIPNHPEFIAHRHDQSLFSLLCKKNNIQPFVLGEHEKKYFSFDNLVISTDKEKAKFVFLNNNHILLNNKRAKFIRKLSGKYTVEYFLVIIIKLFRIFKKLLSSLLKFK